MNSVKIHRLNLLLLMLFVIVLPLNAAAQENMLASAAADDSNGAAAAAASPAAPVKQALASGVIEVHSEALVNGEQILLKNIARVRGFDPPTKASLELIYISQSPNPGRIQTLSRRYIEKVLASRGVGGEWKIPENVAVSRASQKFSDEVLEKMLIDSVSERTGLDLDRISLKLARKTGGVALPKGEINMQVEFPSDERFNGLSTAKITPYINGKEERAFFVTARVDLQGEAVFAARELNRDEVVGPDDIEVREVSLSRLPSNVIRNPEEVLGMLVTARVRQGEAMRTTAFEAPELIKRGDLVQIVIETRGMRVESRGIAKENGRMRDVIKVMNMGSNKIVYGQVTAIGEVRVPF